jgi:alcohol dehydrogenase
MAGDAMGATIIGLDIVPERLEMARKLGAQTVIDASIGDPVSEIVELTDGYGADAAVETSGASAAQTNALNALRRRGKLIIVGVGTNKEWTIRPREQVMSRELCIQGSHGFEISDWEPMLAFVRRHRLTLAAIVGGTFPAEQAAEAFAYADTGREGKAVLSWK